MSLTAKLQFGDNIARLYSKEYLLSDFKCHIVRRHNEVRPDDNATCDCMELVVIAPGREDLNLYEWYVSRSSQSGRILVELSSADQKNSDSAWKEIIFENAVCFGMAEEYDIDKNRRRSLRLSLAVDEITVDTVSFI